MEFTVSWFSAGVSSAVATKLAIDRVDKIFYIHIENQHPDTMRFVRDCERWFGKPVEVLQSPYKSVENVCRCKRFINGPSGACCTRLLKKMVRQQYEYELPPFIHLNYVWGMDLLETQRCARLQETMPDFGHIFPLIENNLTKEAAHKLLFANGIKRPLMYDLGYHNNNCVGCVKGGKGYWNKIRTDFPEAFTQMALLEREIGASCIRGGVLGRTRLSSRAA